MSVRAYNLYHGASTKPDSQEMIPSQTQYDDEQPVREHHVMNTQEEIRYMDPVGKYGDEATTEFVRAIRHNRKIDEDFKQQREAARVFTYSQEVEIAQVGFYGNYRADQIRAREPVWQPDSQYLRNEEIKKHHVNHRRQVDEIEAQKVNEARLQARSSVPQHCPTQSQGLNLMISTQEYEANE